MRSGRFKPLFVHLLLLTVPSIIVAFLLLELFFRFVIPATSFPVGCFDDENLVYKACPNQRGGVATFGKFARQRGRWRINNDGWNSPVDYDEKGDKPRIAVIGDSFIEAFTVDTDKAYPALLEEKLGGRYDVYRFGISGAPLSEYLNLSRYVDKYFDPDIVILNVVHNDFHESVLALKPEYGYHLTVTVAGDSVTENKPKPDYSFVEYDWKKRWLRKSALVRYVIFNLRLKQTLLDMVTPRSKRRYVGNVEAGKYEEHIDTVTKATDYIVGRVQQENKKRGVIFVMAALNQDIYNNTLDRSGGMILNRLLRDTCARHGVDFLDLTDSMARDWAAHRIEFNSPYDGHWNDYAHRLVCDEVYRFLEERGYLAAPSRDERRASRLILGESVEDPLRDGL